MLRLSRRNPALNWIVPAIDKQYTGCNNGVKGRMLRVEAKNKAVSPRRGGAPLTVRTL